MDVQTTHIEIVITFSLFIIAALMIIIMILIVQNWKMRGTIHNKVFEDLFTEKMITKEEMKILKEGC